ncbi:UNVERIFIED_CONTAM: hypothetical protein RMT77_001860 [Armadillidium vulgare]
MNKSSTKKYLKKKIGMSNLVQYVIVRKDLLTSLSWPVGAIIAQACHATVAVTHMFYNDENMIKYLEDIDNMRKVVLSISSEQKLVSLSSQLVASNVDHKLWVEQPEDIPTCLVTKPYPKDDVQHHFKKLKLFKYEP